MGWISNGLSNLLNLNTQDRESIWRTFGSFHANKLGLSQTSFIDKGYEGNVDVYAVITKIVDSLKTVPTIVEKRQKDGEWIEIKDTTIHELMDAPNVPKGYTWDDIEEQRAIYLLASGNGYLIGETQLDKDLIEAVDVLPSQNIDIKSTGDFFLPEIQYRFDLDKTKRTYLGEQIQHIRNFNPGYRTVSESLKGLSVIQVASSVVQVGNDRWDANANLLQNRGAFGLITDKSQRPMTPSETDDAQSALDNRIAGVSKTGKTIVTNKDLNFIKLAMSPQDLQLVESGNITLRAICNVYGLDSSLFNDPANKTFNNRKEAEKALYTNAVMPIANKIDAADTMYIALNHFPDGSVRMRKDFSGVEALQQDKKQEAEKDRIKMAGVNVILNMPISPKAKEQLLVSEYDFTEAEAQGIITPSGKKNEALDILQSVSPLLANKIVEKLSDEEVRGLLNL